MKMMNSPRGRALAIDAAASDEDQSSGFATSSETSEDDVCGSLTTQQSLSLSPQKYGLGDAFYDCLKVTSCSIGKGGNKHVLFKVLLKEMEGGCSTV